MSVISSKEDNVNEESFQSQHEPIIKSDNPITNRTTVSNEKMVQLSTLIQLGRIERDYIRHSTKMKLPLLPSDDQYWNTILEEIDNKEYPLQELQLTWGYGANVLVEPEFIEFAKIIGVNSTLIKFDCSFSRLSSNTRGALLFEELKNNHSIKHIRLACDYCDLNTIHEFAKLLVNNSTLLSLDMLLHSDPGNDCWRPDEYEPPVPIHVETVVELSRLLETTVLQRLKIRLINNESFQVLTKYLPKTLIHLDITNNEIDQDIIPILHSYLNSNGKNLKELILDDTLAQQYLQDQQSSSLSFSTVKVASDSSLQAKLLRNEQPLCIDLRYVHNSNWFESASELLTNDKSCQQLDLNINSGCDPTCLNYVKLLIGKQSRLTSLELSAWLYDASMQIDVVQQLKENDSIIELSLYIPMESNVFNEFLKVLMNKNNLTRLDLLCNSHVKDEEAINLAKVLKNNTVLQKLTLNDSRIGDTGFQVLLSSLSNTLSQLIIIKSRISAKSLPFLLTFIKARPQLKYISLETNGISNSSIDVNVPDLIENIFQTAYKNHCICYLDINESVKNAMEKSTGDDMVSLSFAYLRDDHVLELCDQIKKQPNRNWSLNLSLNEEISCVAYRYLADILSSSTITLVELDVSRNNMDEESRAILLNSLCNKNSLKNFSIYSNQLNNNDMESIAHLVENNSMLEKIDLGECGIDSDGIANLANVLPKSTLVTLNLHGNLIDDRGCASLLSSIPRTLTTLTLYDNKITIASTQTILDFLNTNRTLKSLEILRSNPIADDITCGEQIRQAAQQINICELY